MNYCFQIIFGAIWFHLRYCSFLIKHCYPHWCHPSTGPRDDTNSNIFGFWSGGGSIPHCRSDFPSVFFHIQMPGQKRSRFSRWSRSYSIFEMTAWFLSIIIWKIDNLGINLGLWQIDSNLEEKEERKKRANHFLFFSSPRQSESQY